MAHPLMTIEEAARHLGVSHRTVRSYIGNGLLGTTRIAGDKHKWLAPDAVEELRKDRIEVVGQSPSARRRELLDLKSTVRRLVSEMELVLRILDMRETPLQLAPEKARTLHVAALAELRSNAWTVEELAQWAEIFLRLREEDFLVVHEQVHEKPWVPFMRLCVTMIIYAHDHPAYTTDVELQGVHGRLTEGRRRMRVAALCYADMYETDQDHALRRAALLDNPASIRENLLRRARKAG